MLKVAPRPAEAPFMRRHVLLAATGSAVLTLVSALVAALPATAPAAVPSRITAHPVLTHLDDAPRGVDVRAGASTAALLARSGAATHRPVFRARTLPGLARAGSRTATDARDAGALVTALSVPGGTAVLGGLAQHVSPSCTGTTDGDRVQALYVRETSTASRYTDVHSSLLSFVADVDDTFALSSPTSGRRVRWVQDASCVPVLPEVVVPDGTLTGNGGLGDLARALAAQGYNRSDRKYLAFADAATLCGVGQMVQDSDPSSANANNGAMALYARVDAGCWATRADYHSSPAHELMHMLGAVQPGAPHATTNGHCTDESDAMCYDDGSGQAMTSVCTAAGEEALLDCRHDDYFDDAAPAGYLAGAWNTARSAFLDTVPALGAGTTSTTTSTSGATTAPAPASVTVTVSAPRGLYVGGYGRVYASVASAAGAVATGVRLQSWTRATGWRTLASATTSSTGKASFAVRLTRAGTLTSRVVVPATTAVAGATSATVSTAVVRRPTSGAAAVRTGRPDRLAVTVRTNARLPVAGQYVTLQVRYAGSTAWRTVTRRLTDRLGHAAVGVQPRRRAAYRWVYPGSWNLAPSTSASLAVRY